MPGGIIGKKLGMTQIFDKQGHQVSVTVVQAGPCSVIQRKTIEKDGYSAIQLSFGKTGKRRTQNKALAGHYKKAGLAPQRVLTEFRIDENVTINVGDTITVEQFKPLDTVTVTGISKGRGFTGVMKRHGFAGKDAGHGVHEAYRHGGSIGCRTPKRTIKGMKMAGRMGGKRVTIKGLKILLIDKTNNLLLIKGSIPGWKNGYVLIKKQ